MAKPARNAPPESLRGIARTFFVTSKFIEGRNLLQSERKATFFIDVVRSYTSAGKFTIHDFVVMARAGERRQARPQGSPRRSRG